MQLSDVLTIVGIGVPLVVAWIIWSLRTLFTVQRLRAEVESWKASYGHEKDRADALTRRDDEERQAGIAATKMVEALRAAGIIGPGAVIS